mmetsp:Transcript_2507/g.3614  ORF Transcript_2507/g.3614 Transcript_2507/m.3614 type:complete len:1241 (+) Transcript_2507:138-3860(+)
MGIICSSFESYRIELEPGESPLYPPTHDSSIPSFVHFQNMGQLRKRVQFLVRKHRRPRLATVEIQKNYGFPVADRNKLIDKVRMAEIQLQTLVCASFNDEVKRAVEIKSARKWYDYTNYATYRWCLMDADKKKAKENYRVYNSQSYRKRVKESKSDEKALAKMYADVKLDVVESDIPPLVCRSYKEIVCKLFNKKLDDSKGSLEKMTALKQEAKKKKDLITNDLHHLTMERYRIVYDRELRVKVSQVKTKEDLDGWKDLLRKRKVDLPNETKEFEAFKADYMKFLWTQIDKARMDLITESKDRITMDSLFRHAENSQLEKLMTTSEFLAVNSSYRAWRCACARKQVEKSKEDVIALSKVLKYIKENRHIYSDLDKEMEEWKAILTRLRIENVDKDFNEAKNRGDLKSMLKTYRYASENLFVPRRNVSKYKDMYITENTKDFQKKLDEVKESKIQTHLYFLCVRGEREHTYLDSKVVDSAWDTRCKANDKKFEETIKELLGDSDITKISKAYKSVNAERSKRMERSAKRYNLISLDVIDSAERDILSKKLPYCIQNTNEKNIELVSIFNKFQAESKKLPPKPVYNVRKAYAGKGKMVANGFHGSAINNDHMFYVYSRNRQLSERSYWDTHMSASQFCTNFRARGGHNPACYECLGHNIRVETKKSMRARFCYYMDCGNTKEAEKVFKSSPLPLSQKNGWIAEIRREEGKLKQKEVQFMRVLKELDRSLERAKKVKYADSKMLSSVKEDMRKMISADLSRAALMTDNKRTEELVAIGIRWGMSDDPDFKSKMLKIIARKVGGVTELTLQRQPTIGDSGVQTMAKPDELEFEMLRRKELKGGNRTVKCWVCHGKGVVYGSHYRAKNFDFEEWLLTCFSQEDGELLALKIFDGLVPTFSDLQLATEEDLKVIENHLSRTRIFAEIKKLQIVGVKDEKLNEEEIKSSEQKGGVDVEECWMCRGDGSLSELTVTLESSQDDKHPCCICYGDSKYGMSTECSHFYCNDCIQRSLDSILDRGQFPAYCPMCRAESVGKRVPDKGLITGKALTFLARREVITKEKQFRLMNLQSDPSKDKYFACPHKCGEYLKCVDIKAQLGERLVETKNGLMRMEGKLKPGLCQCGGLVCLRCFAKLDMKTATKHVCKEAKQMDFKTKRLLERICKKCPCCGKYIQKNQGCDTMMCGDKAHGDIVKAVKNGGCGHQFYWSTLRPAKTSYYMAGQRRSGLITKAVRNEAMKKAGFKISQ